MRRAPIDATKPGMLLLEVLVALAIMVLALGILGGQLAGGLRMVVYADEQTRALQFADRILALLELDPETIARIGEEQQTDGDFGEQYPGWFWRVALEITDTEGLGLLTIEVLHQTDSNRRDSIEDARVVSTLHLLKAAPQPIDLAEDFGFSEEQIAQLTASIPLPEFDAGALDPQLVAAMITPETLMDLLPMLLPLLQQIGGGGLPADLSAGNLSELLAGGNLSGGGGANPFGAGGVGPFGGPGAGDLREIIRGAIGDQVSDEELDAMLENVGAGAGGGAGAGPRTIEDLQQLRDERSGGRGGRRP